MPRYIDADKLKKRFCDSCLDNICLYNEGECCDECKMIATFETADVAPVVHAHWLVIETGYLTCSHCGKSFYVGGDVKSQTITIAESGEFEFCPKCGARMDEVKENGKMAN